MSDSRNPTPTELRELLRAARRPWRRNKTQEDYSPEVTRAARIAYDKLLSIAKQNDAMDILLALVDRLEEQRRLLDLIYFHFGVQTSGDAAVDPMTTPLLPHRRSPNR